GFDRICWFEAIGPKYGDGVHAILGKDLNPFPAYEALKTMTSALGSAPKYLGWLNLEGGSLGFVFDTGVRPVLVIWSNTPDTEVGFSDGVTVIGEAGQSTPLAAGEKLDVSN